MKPVVSAQDVNYSDEKGVNPSFDIDDEKELLKIKAKAIQLDRELLKEIDRVRAKKIIQTLRKD